MFLPCHQVVNSNVAGESPLLAGAEIWESMVRTLEFGTYMSERKASKLLKIVTIGDPVLRVKARPVEEFNAELQKFIDDMIETMRSADGVGLAAPQVGRSIRLALIESLPEVDEDEKPIEGSRELYVLLNPEIVKRSTDTVDGIEGCLSVPGWMGEVNRHETIRVRAQDRFGNKTRLRLSGWTARVIQHEIDHLDGKLFIDSLTDPSRIWREEELAEDEAELESESRPGTY